MLDSCVNHAVLSISYAQFMETMGDRIRLLRSAKGWTQSQLADAVGVTKSAVSQWELGQTANIKLATFLKLCASLGARAEYLIFGDVRAATKSTGSAFGSQKS